MSPALLIVIAALFSLSAALAVVHIFTTRRAARAHAVAFEAIAQCALLDHMENQRLKLISSIFRRWPETVQVTLHPEDPLIRNVRPRLDAGRMPCDILLHIYRVNPAAIEIVLDPRRHKMEICDAQKLNLAVTVRRPSPAARLPASAHQMPA